MPGLSIEQCLEEITLVQSDDYPHSITIRGLSKNYTTFSQKKYLEYLTELGT